MKNNIFAISIVLLALACSPSSRAASVTASGSGNWDSTSPDAPWPGGTVPQSADDVIVNAPNTITVVNPAAANSLEVDGSGVVQNNSALTISGNIFGTGTLAQGVNSTLNVGGGTATYANGSISNLLTSAAGNTVNYTGNAFFAKRQGYFNLTFSGFGSFYTANVGIPGDLASGPTPIAGNLILSGPSVQLVNDMPISGNLTIGAGSQFDPSCNAFSVGGETIVNGTLTDGCGISGLTDVLNDLTINPGGTLSMGDVTNWSVSGSITNNGSMQGINHASITLVGSGRLAGSSGVTVPQLNLLGTYEVDAPVTVTTNIVLKGTLIMNVNNSVATPNQLIYRNGTLFYGGNLLVSNVGPALVSGNSFQLFNAASYGGAFSETLPSLSPGLIWQDDSLVNGTFVVTGTSTGGTGSPTLSYSVSGNQMTLSWDAATYPGYVLQSSAFLGATASWSDVAGGNIAPVPITMSGANTFYRLHHP
ncbi:MAG TPA: hypothetical protein VG754_05305 [Verrucomicrobiae bacterium]|nr:hypothetical protein [Verrucomicrobiae bacterium]